MSHLPNPSTWRKNPPKTLDEWEERALEEVRWRGEQIDVIRTRKLDGDLTPEERYRQHWAILESEWRMDQEIDDYYDEEDSHNRWHGLLATLRERAKCEDNYSLNRLQRWAYTAKAAICILLGLHFRPKPAHAQRVHFIDADDDGFPNVITVYRDGYDAKTARWFYDDRVPIDFWKRPITRAEAIKRAEDLWFLRDGWHDVDFIDTGTIDSHGDSYNWSATWMCIPHGWRRWGYHVRSDGDSNY